MISLLLTAAVAASAPVVIQNVRVEVGDGTVRERANVVIDRGRIVSVEGAYPIAARPIDGTGKTLTPGLIATYSRVGIIEIELEPGANDSEMQPPPPYGSGRGPRSSLVPGFNVALGFNPESVWIPIVREEGVTTAIVAPSGGAIAGLGAWADLNGSLTERPNPAKPIALFGGIGTDAVLHNGGARGAVWLDLHEAFADARFFKQHRADYDRGNARPLALSPLHLQALQPVIDYEIPFVIQADRASDILDAIAFSRAEHIKLVIAGGGEAWKVADALAEAKVPVVIEPSHQEPDSFDRVAWRDDLAAVLDRAHIPVVITATGFPLTSRRVRQEAGIAVGAGLQHAAAIQAITLNAAKAFGRDREYGSIQPGKRADLVLWSGDPLELSTVVERVWIGGEEQSLNTRQRQLFERYKTKGP
jgi:imidazolonepropionase-like amidohydrolase